jgi:hypothetical protein
MAQMPTSRFFRLLSLLAALSATSLVNAQAVDAELVRTLLDRIERLEKRVAELESPNAAAAAPQPANPAAPAPPAATAAAMPGMAHDTAPRIEADASHPATQIAGFSDINFVASDQKGAHSGFNEGQFILHISSALSRKVSFFGEMSFTARSDAGAGSPAAAGFNAEVERSIIRYEQNDYFKVSFGRYHTPINYWNTAFHHGSWLQTTASRPEMVQFGGTFIPVHFVGALVEGTAPAAGLNLTYNVGLGNGRGNIISRDGDAGDVNNNRAWLINSFIRPDRFLGMQLGASLYRDRITAAGLVPASEWIEAVHVVRDRENPEIIAEFANIRHTKVDGAVSNSQAFYVQTAYRVSTKFKPYYRYEYTHVPVSDGILSHGLGLSGSTAGVRYDMSPFSALKLEYRSIQRPGLPRINVAFMQTSFTF